MYFGIPDFSVVAAYLLCILSTIACILYGLFNWNKDGDDDTPVNK